MLTLTRLTAAVSLILASAGALACDADLALSRAEAARDANKPFTALSVLKKEQRQCPDNARIPLEIGNIWFELGEYDRASGVWQQALDSHEYPQKVGLNVKLRILRAEARAESRWRHRILLKGLSEFDDGNGGELSTGLLGSFTSIYSMKPMNLSGRAVQSVWFGSLSYFGSQDINITTTTQDDLYSFTTGINQRLNRVTAQSGVRFSSLNQVSETSLFFKPAYRMRNYRIGTDLEWNLTDKTTLAEPYIRADFRPVDIELLARYEQTAGTWTHNRSEVVLAMNLPLDPELAVINNILAGSSEEKLSLTLLRAGSWTVESSASVFQNSVRTWEIGGSVSWRKKL